MGTGSNCTLADLPDSVQIKLQEDIVTGRACCKQVSVLEEKVLIYEAVNSELNAVINEEKQKAADLQDCLNRENRRKKIWRGVSAGLSAVVIVFVILQ